MIGIETKNNYTNTIIQTEERKTMNKIECTFYRPEKVSIREFSNIVRKMEKDLDTFCREPVDEISIRRYVEVLLNQAQPLKGRPEMFFLGLDDPRSMPSDARVDFFYRPTYIGAAIIIRAVLLYPDLLDAKAGLRENCDSEDEKSLKYVFPRLLTGCTGRDFAGAGYEGLVGLIETLTLFTSAGTSEFVEKYPNLCKPFSELYTSSMDFIRNGIKEGTLKGNWGEDYTEKAEQLMELWNAQRQNRV